MALPLFGALQACDVLTTLLFLHHGVAEANPLMRAAILASGRGPLVALAVPKVAALGMALYAARSGRTRLLSRINVLFTCCVAWNLAALAAA